MLIAILSVFSLNFAIAQVGEPKNFCDQNCSAEQERIWSAFERAAFSEVAQRPALYKGSCFHLNQNYDSSHPHHGLFYISEVGGRLHASGLFKFFGQGYGNVELEDAETLFPNHGDPKREMKRLETSRLIDYSSQDTPWRYWLRHSTDMTSVYLVGQWGFFHLLFCELKI